MLHLVLWALLLICIAYALIEVIRVMATENFWFTRYPGKGTLVRMVNLNIFEYIIDGDTIPESLFQEILYTYTGTYWIGWINKPEVFPWEISVVTASEGGKGPITVAPKRVVFRAAIPRKFPVAIDAIIRDKGGLPGRMIVDAMFGIRQGKENDFMAFVRNTPDWLDVLLVLLQAYTSEYTKEKTLEEMRADDAVDLTHGDFQPVYERMNNGPDGTAVAFLQLLSVSRAAPYNEHNPEIEDLLTKKRTATLEAEALVETAKGEADATRHKAEGDADAAVTKAAGKTKVMAEELEQEKIKQQMMELDFDADAYELEHVLKPAEEAGVLWVYGVRAIRDSKITVYAPGKDTPLFIGDTTGFSHPPKTTPNEPPTPPAPPTTKETPEAN